MQRHQGLYGPVFARRRRLVQGGEAVSQLGCDLLQGGMVNMVLLNARASNHHGLQGTCSAPRLCAWAANPAFSCPLPPTTRPSTHTLPPAAASARIAATCPARAAACIAVSPKLSAAFTFLPAAIRRCMEARSPTSAASRRVFGAGPLALVAAAGKAEAVAVLPPATGWPMGCLETIGREWLSAAKAVSAGLYSCALNSCWQQACRAVPEYPGPTGGTAGSVVGAGTAARAGAAAAEAVKVG